METGGQFLRDSPLAPLVVEGDAVDGAGLSIVAASISSSFAADLSSRIEELLPSVVLPSV
jgi:hypothetical protein